ncbi:ribosomal protein S12 methylthiotransferase accessory factor [Actinoalloteichus hoggarensis]|uniref:YcaO-like family protein n=1 Tax=Actinoalloteichus hoggarensis TaxID=1470176 RepID=A0A221W4A5_9PSEU|nr:TOMM precursor leader peptide-binding protein [Actinoalloteichus hoggarensis]ASO20675.1 YcaO-like family protein [Actinoalloteichus hoggarensis]MBB5924472.1 ribosomal protein S12 methylthiotransferase accessory factor [Actinoalloteichus hoggarensis]
MTGLTTESEPRAVGDTGLAAALHALLGEAVTPYPQDGTGLVLLVDDRWDADLRALPVPSGPVLPVHGVGGRLVLGPLVEPGRPGCPQCLALRVRGTGRPEWTGRSAEPLTALSARFTPWWPAAAVPLVAALVRDEAGRISSGKEPRSRDAAFALNIRTLAGRWHPVVPHVRCSSPSCRDAARESPPPLPDLTRRLPASTSGGTRRFDLAHHRSRMQDVYLDSWSGLVTAPSLAGEAALPAVQASVPTEWGFHEIAIGHSNNFADARTAAVLEGLERYAGWHCAGRGPAAVATFADLDDAVDPRRLLLHEDEAYGDPTFEYVPFHPDTRVAWARAHVVSSGRPVLVPFHVAYYGATRDPDAGPSFVYENSNGCAVGAGPEEALLACLLELVERDAFLRAWYSRTPLPELPLTDFEGATAQALRALRLRLGRTLRAFLARGELGLPVVLLVSLSDEQAEPATLITAGCGLDVERALLGAVHEMATSGPAIAANYRQRRDELEPMAAAPQLVRHMTDHALAAALPAQRERFAFLLDPAAAPDPVRPVHRPRGDVAADLAVLLTAAEKTGHEVIVVDHTTPELRGAGLTALKAVVPGLAPMTFGHPHRRMPSPASITEFRRRHGASITSEVRHDPHPFP